MALNTDFRVKDSLYVGNSACFVTCTDTPYILSAGTSLFDIFLQEGEVATNQPLKAGVDGGITSFNYDGTTSQTISISSSLSAKWDEPYNWCQAYSGTILSAAEYVADYCGTTLSAATWVANNGCAVLNGGSSYSQGTITLSGVDDTTITTIDTGLQTGDNVQFTNICGTGTLDIDGNADFNGQILSGGTNLFDIFSEGDITEVTTDNVWVSGGGSSGSVEVGVCSTCAKSWDDAASWCSTYGPNVVLSGSSTSQGTLTLTDVDNSTLDIDLGLQTGDNVQFVDVNATGEILSAGTDISEIFTTCVGDITDVSTDNVWISGGGSSGDVEVGICSTCAKSWDDAASWCSTNGNNVYDTVSSTLQGAFTATDIANNLDPVDLGLTTADSPTFYALSALTVSGDGSGLTGVTATPTFPTTTTSDLAANDKIFVNDDAGSAVSGNKQICLEDFLSDTVSTGLSAGPDAIAVYGADGLTTNKLTKWDGTGFTDSIATDSVIEGASTLTIGGSAVIQGNLTVTGDFTCLDTLVSVTSAIEICNHGTGPALYAEQSGENCVIACFIDSDGGTIVFDDGGNVGIGCDAPGQKLVVAGCTCITNNTDIDGALTVDGNVTLNDAAGDTTTINGSTINLANIQAGTDDTVVVWNGSSLVTDEIDSKVWGTSLVDGEGTENAVPKYTNGTGTIGDSNITDDGTTVVVAGIFEIGNESLSASHEFVQQADNTDDLAYTVTQTYTVNGLSTSAVTIPTFSKTNLTQAKFLVTLVKGVNVTSFEANVASDGASAPIATVYGIVDAQVATQLGSFDVDATNSTLDLDIASTGSDTVAVIQGTALYTNYTSLS